MTTNEKNASLTFVSDRFEKGKGCFSSRASECYHAKDLETQKTVQLWVLRYPLDPSSDQSRQFISRLDKLKQSATSIFPIIAYGVDSRGSAYLVTDSSSSTLLIDSTWVPFELEKHFVTALKTLRELHSLGLALEDVSESTFLLNSDGALKIGSILGDFDEGAKKTAMLPPKDTLKYIAPEQTSGGTANSQTDIFSIGIFAYRLFTGQYPKQSEKANSLSLHDALPPSKIRSDLPTWVDDVVGQCLQLHPSKRYASVNEMLAVVEKAIASGQAPGGNSVWSHATKETKIKEPKITKALVKVSEKDSKKKEKVNKKKDSLDFLDDEARGRSGSLVIWIVSISVGFAIAAFAFLSIGSFDSDDSIHSASSSSVSESEKKSDVIVGVKSDDPIAFMAEYSPPELREFILTVSSTSATTDNRKDALAKIAESKDPTSFGMLVTLIQNGSELFLRQEASILLVEKIKKEGLQHTSVVLEKWLASLESSVKAKKSATYILRSVDIGRPIRARVDSLKQAYLKDPSMGLSIAASLAVDTQDESFIELLREFLAKKMPGEDLSKRGLGALLMSDRGLSGFVKNNANEIIEKFSNEDLLWMLKRVAESPASKEVLMPLLKQISEKQVLTPFRQVFIDSLIESVPTGEDVHNLSTQMIKGSLGEMNDKDVEAFARWDSMQAERVLLAACASEQSNETALRAFDILARRTVTNKTADTLVDWVKNRFWDYRKRFVRSVGILSLRDLATEDQISSAFDDLLPFTKGGLFKVLSSTKDPKLITESVDRMGAITNSQDLVALIDDPSPQVRVAAIRALKDRNELFVLQTILKAYKKEKDPKVKDVYEELHWVTQKNR